MCAASAGGLKDMLHGVRLVRRAARSSVDQFLDRELNFKEWLEFARSFPWLAEKPEGARHHFPGEIPTEVLWM